MIEGAKNLVALSDLVCVGVPCHVKIIGRVGVLGFSLWCFRCTFLLTLKSTSVTIVSLKILSISMWWPLNVFSVKDILSFVNLEVH